MKTFTKAAASLAACAMLFAGCAQAPQPVTEDNAPSEILKKAAAINSESDAQAVIEVLEGFIDATYKGYDGKIILSETATGKGIDTNSETLASAENKLSNYDVRYSTEKNFYQLYEEEGSTSDPVYGLMDSNADGLITVYTSLDSGSTLGNPNGKMTVSAIDSQKESEPVTKEEMTEYIRNSVIYPFYTMLGSSLVLQPTSTPEYYSYKLEKNGDSYVWTMSIREQEEYNAALDETFEQYYGHSRLDLKGDQSLVLDAYDVTTVNLVITTDEKGCIQQIENKNKSTVKQGDTTLELSSDDVVKVKPAEEKWGPFFEGFFAKIADGSIGENDSFEILDSFGNDTAASQEKSSETSAAKDDSKTEEASKESSKADESKASESSKAEASSEKKSEK